MPRIYIDITDTHASRLNTGIQRTVRNIARHLPELAPNYGCIAELVVFRASSIQVANAERPLPAPKSTTTWRRLLQQVSVRCLHWVEVVRSAVVSLSPSPAWADFVLAPRYRFGLSWLIVLPYAMLRRIVKIFDQAIRLAEPSSPLQSLQVAAGDILLLADSTWSRANVWPGVTEFRHRGGRVVMIVYDLIPISHPEYCNPSVVHAYGRWIRDSMPFVDFYACISRSTERELNKYLQCLAVRSGRPIPATGYFHLGSDLDLARTQDQPSEEVQDVAAGPGTIFLAVGSLEPRKNINFILDAFDRIWESSPDARLIIVGHNAWKVDQLIDRIRQHPLFGSQLHWLRHASDTDLEYLYAKATALIFASIIEGFGLPIVEAMQRGLPVLCSDIPVFREIADGKAIFFSLETTDQLVEAVCQTAAACNGGQAPVRRVYPWPNWNESTGMLLDRITVQFQIGRKGNATCG